MRIRRVARLPWPNSRDAEPRGGHPRTTSPFFLTFQRPGLQRTHRRQRCRAERRIFRYGEAERAVLWSLSGKATVLQDAGGAGFSFPKPLTTPGGASDVPYTAGGVART